MLSIFKSIILKFIFFILTFSILVNTFLSIKVYADEGILYTEGDFQYNIVDDSIRIVKYIGNDIEVYVPYSFGLYEVKSIERGAFADTNVQNVYVYDNVASVSGNDNVSFTFLKANGEINNDKKIQEPVVTDDGIDDVESDISGNIGDQEKNDNNEVFEDINEDISIDFDDSDETEENVGFFERIFGPNKETTNEKDRKQVRNRLFEIFDANNFSSNFKAQPVGYFIIIFSIVSIIYLIYRYFIKK